MPPETLLTLISTLEKSCCCAGTVRPGAIAATAAAKIIASRILPFIFRPPSNGADCSTTPTNHELKKMPPTTQPLRDWLAPDANFKRGSSLPCRSSPTGGAAGERAAPQQPSGRDKPTPRRRGRYSRPKPLCSCYTDRAGKSDAFLR